MEKEILQAIIQDLKVEMIWAFVVACVLAVAALYIKGRIEAFVAYINFKNNGEMTKNTRINVRGQDGKIIDFDRKWIRIMTDVGMIPIDMTKWKAEKWIILHNGGKRGDDK